MASKKVGILTGGGDCPGLNAVVRAVTKTALRIGWEVLGFRDGYAGLVENRFLSLGDREVSGILTRGGTILGTSNIANPFSYTLKPLCSPDAPADLSGRAVDNFRAAGLDCLIATGGDGTMSIALKLMDKGIPVIGVPKTIDNDLASTDVTFGFDSALTVATDGVDKIHTTAEAHHRIMILETMGRYAGWIALRAGMAGGGDIILIPEIPYSNDEICAAVARRVSAGKNFSIVVVAEGAKQDGGSLTVQKTVKGSTDPSRLGGIGYRVAAMLEENCEIETRVVVLGHLQRGGQPTPFDRWLATRFGVAAMELAEQGAFGRMVCLRGTEIESVTLAEAVANLKRVDPGGQEVKAALAVGTSFGSTTIK